ncbi:hypothetical protein K2173_011016 [Erythroxylum novogranatense]|uniref:Nucleoporin protein Ndc1-Nup n=1 Tax=Erythroxylum novogranatense TaxID=1862640 RepID=A0AAV8T1M3_9ROSI|nr:hypothetical protein K2173_011016 [Erythroxylum novogranatense]
MSAPLPPSPPPDTVVKNRFLGFLIWQSITSTTIFFLFKAFTCLSLQENASLSSSKAYFLAQLFVSIFVFLTFQLSQLLFSAALAAVSSPKPFPFASPLQILTALIRFLFASGGDTGDFHRRLKVSVGFILFLTTTTASGLASLVSVFGSSFGLVEDGDMMRLIWRVGFRGFVIGLVYGLFYVYKKRWILEFPIIQRPPFFRFKMGLPSAIKNALKLSSAAHLISAVLLMFLPEPFNSHMTTGKFFSEQIIIYIGSFLVFLCWELSHHLHQVVYTKRFIFAPPKGSAAAETNPSEPLLEALEESPPGTLPLYLAYLDLCMVCENNVDTWRRAAVFEETSETYKRVIAVCLTPLEQLTCILGEALEGGSVDKGYHLSCQLQSPLETLNSKYCEAFRNFQQYSWCARSAAALTARSYKEDRYGVAQLSGSNATVISTLLSCLLAVEASMGKKTNLQPLNQFIGPANIKWATMNVGRRDVLMAKKKSGPVHSESFAMSDVLRTSIYIIVSTFQNEMISSAKSGLLEKDWIISSKPSFGTHELLQQKLRLFLDFQAS